MKLREALELVQENRAGPQEIYLLGCSATPAHLATFFRAHLMARRPDRGVEIDSLPYGDLLGGLERSKPGRYSGVAVFCEWYDLDPRLGFRRSGGWAPSVFDDILKGVETGLARLGDALDRLAETAPVALALPTLPLPPLEISVPAQALRVETSVWAAAWAFAERCASRPGIRLMSPAELDRRSPAADRFDLRAEIGQGSPYRLPHASAMAGLMSVLLAPAPPLKGLITDLDDTLWRGILGEVGTSGVAFTLDTGGQIHGLYQQFLQSLIERGVLVAVASRNDAALVEEALSRGDLLLRREGIFPVEAHWGRKSESVARILQTWNIGPEAVAFIDDCPAEGAEVQARFPQLRYLPFPAADPALLPDVFATLRQWFGKPAIREEDRTRSASLRHKTAVAAPPTDSCSREAFLAGLDSRLSFHLSRDAADERAFELINKTNQFNLNGRRVAEAAWRTALGRPDSFLLTCSYTDKFGPLGKIAVVTGERRGGVAKVSSWVMSCRAFSRHVEYATLRQLFSQLEVERLSFDFAKTDRNSPLQEFFSALGLAEPVPELSFPAFEKSCPPLPHALERVARNV